MTRKAKVEAETTTTARKPASLGTKRQCPKCATKFYDFEREEADCPKCGHHINFKNEGSEIPLAAPAKKAKPKVVDDEEGTVVIATESEGGIEPLEDLGTDDDGEDLVEDLDEDDEEDDY